MNHRLRLLCWLNLSAEAIGQLDIFLSENLCYLPCQVSFAPRNPHILVCFGRETRLWANESACLNLPWGSSLLPWTDFINGNRRSRTASRSFFMHCLNSDKRIVDWKRSPESTRMFLLARDSDNLRFSHLEMHNEAWRSNRCWRRPWCFVLPKRKHYRNVSARKNTSIRLAQMSPFVCLPFQICSRSS